MCLKQAQKLVRNWSETGQKLGKTFEKLQGLSEKIPPRGSLKPRDLPKAEEEIRKLTNKNTDMFFGTHVNSF